MTDPVETSRLLTAAGAGDRHAADCLFPLVYQELRPIARRRLRHGGGGHSLSTDELVNEGYLKLAGASSLAWEGQAHFLSIASRAMRQVLVDRARKRYAAKRGGERRRVTLTSSHHAFEVGWDELLALDEALDRLDALNPRLRQVVEYRFFGGMTDEQIGQVLTLSPRTVERDWKKARLFLYRELHPEGES